MFNYKYRQSHAHPNRIMYKCETNTRRWDTGLMIHFSMMVFFHLLLFLLCIMHAHFLSRPTGQHNQCREHRRRMECTGGWRRKCFRGHRPVRPWTLMPWLQRVVFCADDADRAEQWTPRSRSCNECHRSPAIYVCRARTRDILDMVSVIYCRQQRQHRSSTLWTRVVAAGPHVRPRSNQLHDIHRIQTACAKVYRPGGFSERPNAPGELRPWQSWRHLFVRRTGTLEEKLERGMS